MRFQRLAVAAAAAALWVNPVAAQNSGLHALLRAMPESAISYNGYPLVSYVDLRALEQAAGVPTPATESDYRGLPEAEREHWRRPLQLLMTLPSGLGQYATWQMESWDSTLDHAMGLDFFAIDRVLWFGALNNHDVTVLDGGDDLGDPFWMGMGLVRRGFVEASSGSATIWSRFGDGVAAVALTDVHADADPFDADLNLAARVAAVPGRVTVAHFTADLEATLAAGRGEAPSARISEIVAAMFDAVSATPGGNGTIIQGWAHALPTVGLADPGLHPMLGAIAGPEPIGIDALRDRLAAAAGVPPATPLAPYPLALFAEVDTTEGNQINAIALPYADPAAATAAADIVAARLGAWMACPGTQCLPAITQIGGRISTFVVDDSRVGANLAAVMAGVVGYAPGSVTSAEAVAAALAVSPPADGGAIAVIAVAYPQPPEGGAYAFRGRLLQLWYEATINRDLTPLAVP